MEPVETGSTASVSGHIWAALSRVNRLLQFYFAEAQTGGFPPFFAHQTYGIALGAFKREPRF
jgi:hypothetical protein